MTDAKTLPLAAYDPDTYELVSARAATESCLSYARKMAIRAVDTYIEACEDNEAMFEASGEQVALQSAIKATLHAKNALNQLETAQ